MKMKKNMSRRRIVITIVIIALALITMFTIVFVVVPFWPDGAYERLDGSSDPVGDMQGYLE